MNANEVAVRQAGRNRRDEWKKENGDFEDFGVSQQVQVKAMLSPKKKTAMIITKDAVDGGTPHSHVVEALNYAQDQNPSVPFLVNASGEPAAMGEAFVINSKIPFGRSDGNYIFN